MPPPPPPPAVNGAGNENLSKAILDYRRGYVGYFEDNEEGWIMAEITSDAVVHDGSIVVSFRMLHNGETRQLSTPISALDTLPPLKNPDNMDYVDDLSQLSYLHEPAVFSTIKNRFIHKEDPKIYTYSGMALIAMNPFAKVDIYSEEIMKEYAGKSRDSMQPHIYGIAEECYRAMLAGRNQSVIVSGESGAGKTQSTKYIMQYLAVVDSLTKSYDVSDIRHSETEDAVLASNPILESFGNAKTTRNDNSSRFGKFVELFFSDRDSQSVRITGAKIRTYLLERSRLIFQPQSERNYHIFYQLCTAAPAAEKKKLGLDKWESFHYLNQGRAGIVKNINDVQDFKDTQNALSTVGIPVENQWEIFKICAALLHLGNVQIHGAEDGSKDISSVSSSDSALEQFVGLLGLDKTEFMKWVTKKQTMVMREAIVKNLSVDLATVARDSVTKAIYTKLFDWLVAVINTDLQRESVYGQNFIGVLDIYGFEHFAVNSFEQFCINYANEKLQQEFTRHVFRLEQEEYIKEGIEWSMIQFSDNQPCIDLIEGKVGILSILDDVSKVQNSTDAQFIDSMNNSLATPGQKYYSKAKFGNETFSVKHYAVDVSYTAANFIDKNKDSVSEELRGVLGNSTNAFFKDVFLGTSEPSEGEYQPLGKSVARRGTTKGKPSLGSMFKASLESLMETIRATEGHYIRCIKPNMAKAAFGFEGPAVLGQLKACGVLETIKISNEGFPSKLSYEEFVEGYHVLVSSDFWNSRDKRDVCNRIVTRLIDDPAKYQFGKTKIFFKSGQIAFFDARRRDRVIYLMNFGQKNIKRFLQRIKYKRTLAAIAVLQTAAQTFIAKNKLKQLKYAAALRKAEEERKAQEVAAKAAREEKLIILLQSCIRRRLAATEAKLHKADAKSIEKVKEKSSGMESKIVSLSMAVGAKADEIKVLNLKLKETESKLKNALEQLSSAESRVVMLDSEVVSLRKESAELKASGGRLGDGAVLMSRSPSRGVLGVGSGNRSPSRAPMPDIGVNRSNSVNLKSDIASLRSENESLKRMLEEARATDGDSAKMAKPMRQFSLARGKSIYSGDIFDLAERERQKNMGTAGVIGAALPRTRTTSAANNAAVQAQKIQMMERPEFSSHICDALILRVQIPMYSPNAISRKEAVFSAHLIGSVFQSQLELGMIVELHDFCLDIVDAFQQKARADGNNKAILAFLITNACELLGIVHGMQKVESHKPNSRSNMNILSKVRNILYHLIDIDLAGVFVAQLAKEVTPIARSLLEAQDLSDFALPPVPKSTWGLFGVQEEETNLVKVNRFLVDLVAICEFYFLPDDLYKFILMEVIRTLGSVAFNDLLQRRGFLSPNRAMQIDNNVNTVLGWYVGIGLQALSALEILKEAAKIATMEKNTQANVAEVFQVANHLNANQVQQILTMCYSAGPGPDGHDIPISLEFREVIRGHAIASKGSDMLAVALVKLDKPLDIPSVQESDKYIPPSVVIADEYFALFRP
ncbi:P-loop containing nucleoside triphosphate hydrolase protein [Chytriomyces sp. MP71]|nr:P-loop containing nucleoside triphosphate hydrolase protein [Chytriomyces sp. MP71]